MDIVEQVALAQELHDFIMEIASKKYATLFPAGSRWHRLRPDRRTMATETDKRFYDLSRRLRRSEETISDFEFSEIVEHYRQFTWNRRTLSDTLKMKALARCVLRRANAKETFQKHVGPILTNGDCHDEKSI